MIGALLLGAAPTMAQNDNKAIIENVTKIIASKSPTVEEQVKNIFKENKKNTEVLVGIGQAYLNVKDTANAAKYADLALKRDGKYAKAWILKGDIAVMKDDGGEAATNYQNAMYFDPKEPDGYYKYALIQRGVNPQAAVDALEQLRKNRPDFPVDAYSGRIYYNAGKFEDAAKSYAKVSNLMSMEDEDITNYAISQWLLGKRQESIDICKAALQKNPRKAGWNRVAFYCYTDLKQPTEALDYADRLFNKSDSAHFTEHDYTYYGTALKLAKRYDEAIDAFNKAIEMNKDNAKQLAILNRNLSDIYMAKADYDNAVAYLEKTMGEKPSFDDIDGLGQLWADIAAKKTQAKDAAGALECFKKADQTYAKLMELYPNYSNYGNYMRAQLNANMDPDSKQGLAKPFYEALAQSLSAKQSLNNSEKQMLEQAYTYMIVYAFNVKQDKAQAKEFAQKLLQINPDNEVAKQVAAM